MRKFDGDINNPLFKHKILIVAAPYYKSVVNGLIKAAKEVLFNSIKAFFRLISPFRIKLEKWTFRLSAPNFSGRI